ncbi:MAG: response regulator [Patescibacteria group bacterium]|nr:response regulator [Patescibacteria group bacterium]
MTQTAKRVFLLEDEIDLCEIYTSMLENEGYDVRYATNSTEAEKTASNFNADLLLIDHNLRHSEKHGLEILPLLKKQNPNAKIVIFTNYGEDYIKQKALQAGADQCWIKLNFSKKKFLEAVEQLLQ